MLLNDYLAHQRKLLPALATTYALHFAQDELVVALMHEVQGADGPVDEHRQRELESRAAGLKAAQTWHATRTIQMCREACGGAGYLAENRLPGLKADTDVFTTFEGDNTVLLQLVAKGLLTGYRDAFGSLDGWGRASFVAEQVREMVLERTAARSLIQRLVDAVPGRDEEVAAHRPRLAAQDVRGPGEAPARRRGPPAAQRRGHEEGPSLRHLQRRPGPRADVGRRAHRPGRAGGVRRRHRRHRRPGVAGAALPGLRPVRAERDRGQQGLVPGARPAHPGPLQGDHRQWSTLCSRSYARTCAPWSTPSPSRTSG